MYKYFVSYSHSRGYGNLTTNLESPIEDIEDTKSIAREVEANQGLDGVAVLNFILLSGPK